MSDFVKTVIQETARIIASGRVEAKELSEDPYLVFSGDTMKVVLFKSFRHPYISENTIEQLKDAGVKWANDVEWVFPNKVGGGISADGKRLPVQHLGLRVAKVLDQHRSDPTLIRLIESGRVGDPNVHIAVVPVEEWTWSITKNSPEGIEVKL